jgi:hypothetical protein
LVARPLPACLPQSHGIISTSPAVEEKPSSKQQVTQVSKHHHQANRDLLRSDWSSLAGFFSVGYVAKFGDFFEKKFGYR